MCGDEFSVCNLKASSLLVFLFLMIRRPAISTLFPYTTLFRSVARQLDVVLELCGAGGLEQGVVAYEPVWAIGRSEEHTSELQSHHDLVCRLLLEKKNNADNVHKNLQSSNPPM